MLLEALGDPGRHLLVGGAAGGTRFLEDVHRVALVELREERQPAVAHRQHVHVGRVLGLLREHLGARRPQRLERHAVVAPLVGVEVEVRGRVHLPAGDAPVGGAAERADGGEGSHLLGADVVVEAAAVAPHAAGEDAHHGFRSVDERSALVPVEDARAGDEHASALRLLGGVGPLARYAQHQVAVDAGLLFLPGRRERLGGVVVVLRVGAGEAARHAELGQQQVVGGGDAHGPVLGRDHPGRYAAHVRAGRHALALGRAELDVEGVGEVGEGDARLHPVAVHQGEGGFERLGVDGVLELEVPPAGGPLLPTETERAAGKTDAAAGVEERELPVTVLLVLVVAQVGGAQEAAGDEVAVFIVEPHQERQVGVLRDVRQEVCGALVDVELLQDHVDAREQEGGVGAGADGHPEVGELGDVGVVGREVDDLAAVVLVLRGEVRVGRARHREVRAHHDPVGALVPVGRLPYVGLVAPDHRHDVREVVVPLVEAQHGAAEQVRQPLPREEADHAHGRDGRERRQVVGAVALDGVDLGGGDDLGGLVPGAPAPTGLAAGGAVRLGSLRVLDDGRPRLDRAFAGGAFLPVEVEQHAAHVRVLGPHGRVRIPGRRDATLATARFVVGGVVGDLRPVGLLQLPGDHPVLDEHLPGAGTRAVDAVAGAHRAVVRPAAPVELLPGARFVEDAEPAGGAVLAVGATLAVGAAVSVGAAVAVAIGAHAVGFLPSSGVAAVTPSVRGSCCSCSAR